MVRTFTLWRGDTLIVQADLAHKHDPLSLGGVVEPSDELEALGPMIQQTAVRDGRTVIVQEPIRRDADVEFGRDIRKSTGSAPIYAQHGPVYLPPPESVLYLRDEESNVVHADLIWVIDPILLRTGFLDDAPPELLQYFKKWQLMCHLSEPLGE